MRERSKHARVSDDGAVVERKGAPAPARLRDALVERLDDIERKIEDEIATEEERHGAVEQLVADVAREARDVGARLLRTLAGPRTLATRLASALASPVRDANGVDVRLRDAVADALRPIA